MAIRGWLKSPICSRGSLRNFAFLAFLSACPLIGQLIALGYANRLLARRLANDPDLALPKVEADYATIWTGIKLTILTFAMQILVISLSAPFVASEAKDADAMTPTLVLAFRGPSSMLFTLVTALLTSLVVTRFALTGSMLESARPSKLWDLLRAEPALWITYSTVGFALMQGAGAIAWILPFSASGSLLALTIASSLFWSLGLLINVRLMSSAYRFSMQTARRRAMQVRYRW